MIIIHMHVNGKDVEVAIDERESLADTLRERLGLTSVKKGCEVGECGACTVLVDGKAIGSLRVYSAVARNFTEEEVEFAGAIANLSAIAIENARMHQALKTDYELLTAYNNTIHEL